MGSPVKSRSLINLAGIGGEVDFGCHNSDVLTAARGLLERVFFVNIGGEFVPPPQPLAGAFEAQLSLFHRRYRRSQPSTTPLTRQQFVACYTGRKFRIYENAVESLRLRPLERKDAFVTTFVKIEKLNFTAKPDPAPRVIQPATPRYNVELGRYIKPIEKLIYRRIDKVFGDTVVAKGMNASERGKLIAEKWRRFHKPVAVGLDAKRYDQHVSLDALRYEHQFYVDCYEDPFHKAELRGLLNWQLYTRGYVNCADGEIMYEVEGGRCSGHSNTALGNTILMCAKMWSFLNEIGVDFAFVNDGDDSVLIIEEHDLPRLEGLEVWFLRLGFQMERDDLAYELEHIQFCQCRPVLGGDGKYKMVRDPRICLSKDSITTKSLRVWEYDSYRKGVSDCGIAMAGDMPVMGEFYACLGRGATAAKTNNFDQQFYRGLALASERMHCKLVEPTPATRASFYKAFDITPDRQVAIESEYRIITPVWQPCDIPRPTQILLSLGF